MYYSVFFLGGEAFFYGIGGGEGLFVRSVGRLRLLDGAEGWVRSLGAVGM